MGARVSGWITTGAAALALMLGQVDLVGRSEDCREDRDRPVQPRRVQFISSQQFRLLQRQEALRRVGRSWRHLGQVDGYGPMRIGRLGRPLLASTILAVLAAGCARPLEDLHLTEGVSGEVCSPSDPQGRATIGLDYLTNEGDSELTILEVHLVGASNLEIAVWGLEEDGPDGTGAARGFVTASGDWPTGPLAPDDTVHLVVGVRVPDRTTSTLGRADRVRLVYQSDDGQQGELLTAFSLEVSPSPSVPCF